MAKKKNQQYLLRDKRTGLGATTDSATALFRRIGGDGDVEKGTVEEGAKK
ncbi:hypothetical protein [Siphonobacter sp. BAB-5385]|nr:hypothetical protein [Siphonobacter sp. BAB-5385]